METFLRTNHLDEESSSYPPPQHLQHLDTMNYHRTSWMEPAQKEASLKTSAVTSSKRSSKRPLRPRAEGHNNSSSSSLQHHTATFSSGTGKRQRKLLPLSIFLGPLATQPPKNRWWRHPWEDDDSQNAVALPTQLLMALILTTGLGALSALDAKYQCLKHETAAALELVSYDNANDDGAAVADQYYNRVDDQYQDAYEAALEQARLIEAHGCLKMFRGVCLPVLGATWGLGALGLWILRRRHTTSAAAVRWTAALVLVLLLILGAQTYLVTLIMLKPRNQDNSENPFHSLGAVDVTGQIGDNANLYYLVWLGEILSLILVYQAIGAHVRARKADSRASMTQGLLPATSWWIVDEDYDRENHESRYTWYKSLYMLRVRTGMWTAASITCLVLIASAQYVWRQFMWPYVLLDEGNTRNSGDGIFDPMDFSLCQTMSINSLGLISVTLCRRTVMAWFSGVVSFLLSAFSIGMHLVARARAHGLVSNEHRQQLYYMQRINIFRKLLNRHRVPLGIELILSILLSLLLGLNAVMSTGVKGPATQVGNLYYASWGAFLLVGRIAVGCLEEWFQVEPKDDKSVVSVNSGGSNKKLPGNEPVNRDAASTDSGSKEEDAPGVEGGADVPQSFETENSDTSATSNMMDALEKDRVKRLRNYFFLCVFSACCGSAAVDAGVNGRSRLSAVHRYMILSPFVVAAVALILFCLCLSKRCYRFASHMCVGGVLSVISFALWLANLVLTMHSDHSWAVNSIGEIRMANLYYFCWASILTAGS